MSDQADPSIDPVQPPKNAESTPPAPEKPVEQKPASGPPPAPADAEVKPAPPVDAQAPAATPEPQTPPAPTPAGPLPRIALVVDDEPANRDFLVRLLEQARLEVKGASTGAEAISAIEGLDRMMLIVIDNKLPDMDGIDLLAQLRTRYPEARMIMATMLDEREVMTRAFEAGCDVFLVKPHGFMELFRRLQAPEGSEDSELKRLIIDQYGPRPFRA